MIATFYIHRKPKNSTKLPEGGGEDYEVLYKEPVFTTKPIITISRTEGTTEWNYCYIKFWNRYYYITENKAVNARMIELHLEVDVMTTYREELLHSEAFVLYAESAFNTMIPDSRLPISDVCRNIYYEHVFPPYSQDGAFVLSFASKDSNGETGAAVSMVTDSSGLSGLMSNLFVRNDWESLLRYYNNPLDMLISCIWLPIGTLFLTGSSGTFKLGDSDIALSGHTARKSYSSTIQFEVELPYKTQLPDGSYTYADYRNVEPYTQYSMTLPGVGMVDIPMSTFINDGMALPKVRLNYTIACSNGQITYEMCNGDTVVAMFKGNLGVQVPFASASSNMAGHLAGMISAIGGLASMTGGFISGNPLLTAGGGMAFAHGMTDSILKPEQTANAVSGSLGGFNSAPYCEFIKVCVRPYTISDNPGNVASTIGRPLFAKRILGQLSGYVKCTGCYPIFDGTAEEIDLMNALVNNYALNDYGGIIIE